MPPRVGLVEDYEDLRLLVTQLVKARFHVECLTFASVADLKARESDVLLTELMLLDVNLGAGEPTGVDACLWLREKSYAGRIFFFSGHARNNPLLAAAAVADVPILEKPVNFKDLLAIIADTLALERGPHGQ